MLEQKHSLVPYTGSEVIMGRPIAPLERSLAPHQLTLMDLLRTLVKQKLTIFGFAAIMFALAAGYAYTRVPIYEGVARLQIDPSRSTNLGLDDGEKAPGSSPEVDSHVKTEVAIIQSDAVAMRVINSLKLFSNSQFAGPEISKKGFVELSNLSPSQRQQMLAEFSSSLNVKVVPNTQIVEVRFRSPSPALATEVANSLVDEYMKRNFMARVDGTIQVSQWLSRELGEIKASTAESQQKLAEFQRDNNMLGADESDNIVTNRLKQLNEELTQAEAERIVKEGRYRLAHTGNPELIDSTLSNTSLQAFRMQQADLQGQYNQLSTKFGKGYPKLRELQQQLVQLNAQIAKEGVNIETRLDNEFLAASRTESMIRTEFDKQKSQASKLNEHAAQYANLKHQVEAGQQLYDTLQLKLKTAGITSGLASSFVDVIDRAQIPDKPVEPRKSLYLALGLGGGLFGGLLLGLVRDSFDDTVRTAEELEAFTLLPELVSIPYLPDIAKKAKNEMKRARPLIPVGAAFSPIAFREPNSPAIESYRALCSVILLSAARNGTKTLVVTSAVPGEGKTTVSCNLATAIAQRGRKVLLVDADLRCSSIHSQMGVRPGLTTMCAAGAANHPRYQPIADLPTLHVVPAGIRPTDPTSVLDSARMHELMISWREEYDHIIIDTPPVLPFADAMVLASRADGVILVARSGMSRSKPLLRARDLLARSGVNILGMVLNAVRDREYYYEYPEGYETLSKRDYQELPQQ
jgi:polysaccharide biosynthesis transport protein